MKNIRTKSVKSLISFLLAVALTVTAFPVAVFAISEEYTHPTLGPAVGEGMYGEPIDSSGFSVRPYVELTSEEEAVEYIRQMFIERRIYANLYFNFDYEGKYTDVNILARLSEKAYERRDENAIKDGEWIHQQLSYQYSQSNDNYPHYHKMRRYYNSTAEQETAVDLEVKRVIQTLGLEGMSDYGKIKAINDYLVNTVTYGKNGNDVNDTAHSAYGALVKKRAVCQGYALAMYRLCMEVGVPSRYISGYAGGPHAWVIVKLGGMWYMVDPTWNDSGYPYKYFLNLDESVNDHERSAKYSVSSEFGKKYPMASLDGEGMLPAGYFAPGNFGTKAYTYTALDGFTETTACQGRAKIQVFYDSSSEASHQILKMISESEWLMSGALDVTAFEVGGLTEEELGNSSESYSKAIGFVASQSGNEGFGTTDLMNYYRRMMGIGNDNLPLVVMSDSKGYIRYIFHDGVPGANELKERYIPNLLNDGPDNTRPDENFRVAKLLKEENNLLGDVNSDGKINVNDKLILTKYLSGDYLESINQIGADVNGDKKINASDIISLKKLLAG